MNCLKLSSITKCYGEKVALNNVSFSLTPGIYGLLGPNGAGKSTLMQILTLSTKASGGSFFWNDQEIVRTKRNKKAEVYFAGLSYVPQKQVLYPEFTAWEYLDYMASLKGISSAAVNTEIKRVLLDVELWEHAYEKIRTFSGGMKQRLMIAQGLMNKPALLLLDEPTTGLDPRQRMVLKESLKKLSKDTIILLSTHIVSDIEALADSVILLNHGQVIKMCSPKQLVMELSDKLSEENQMDHDEVLSDLEKAYLYYLGEGSDL